MRFLILQTAFIGDIVLTTPLFAAISSRFPDAEIHVVTTPQGRAVLNGNKNLILHTLDKKDDGLLNGFYKNTRNLLKQINLLASRDPFDAVLCVHRSARSLWLAKNIKAKRYLAFDSLLSKSFGFETVNYPEYDPAVHYADKPLKLFESYVSSKVTRGQPQLVVSAHDRAHIKLKLKNTIGNQYIVVSPFSVWGTKMWFGDRFAKLSAEMSLKYKCPVVIIGENQNYQKVVATTIVEKVTSAGGNALSLVGETSLGELKAVIADSKLLVANDSAPIHIAAAFNIPTVAIFGPTTKKWGFFPLSQQNRVVENSNLSCRPCHLHGPMRCPKKHFKCMDEIQVEDVMNAVKDMMQ